MTDDFIYLSGFSTKDYYKMQTYMFISWVKTHPLRVKINDATYKPIANKTADIYRLYATLVSPSH